MRADFSEAPLDFRFCASTAVCAADASCLVQGLFCWCQSGFVCGGWTLMLVIPPEGLTRRIFGPGTGPGGTGQPMRFIWNNFEAKCLVLDPFGTKFDALGASHNIGQDLTSPVRLSAIPTFWFVDENGHPWI